ncbi:alanine racemase [Candidatus Daviesbacteria bacterium]|nr:alanine racemase [Candidatus Daviesbacteria bacterium]
MLDKLIKALKREYQTLNIIEISRNNLLSNFKYLASLNKKIKIAPVVKSNGYGHGIENIAKILDDLNFPFFCVDSLFEAYLLQKALVINKVLVMGYTNPENLKVKKLPFSFAVFDLETAKVLNEFQPGCKIHIFVDTGMHREGIPVKDLPQFLEELKKLPNIKIDGLMSHLASSESKSDPIFASQIKQFQKAKEICKKLKINPKWFHISATGGIVNPKTRSIIASISNLVRAGLALYGFSSSTFDPNLKPVLTLKTKISQIKKIKKREKVGYNGTYIAKKELTVGILPIGYYDGIDRRLSNKGWVTINNIPCKILGRVSMNINSVDLTKITNPQVGQEVVVFSSNPQDPNSIGNVAKACKTIPYDILISLASSTKRIII